MVYAMADAVANEVGDIVMGPLVKSLERAGVRCGAPGDLRGHRCEVMGCAGTSGWDNPVMMGSSLPSW